jgi:hypothetical protein
MVAQAIVQAGASSLGAYIDSWKQRFNFVNWLFGFSPVRSLSTKALSKYIEKEMHRNVTPWIISSVPQELFDNPYFQRTLRSWRGVVANYDTTNFWRMMISSAVFIALLSSYAQKYYVALMFGILAWCSSMLSHFFFQRRMRLIEEDYLRRRDALPEYARNFRDNSMSKGILYAASLCIGVKLLLMWNSNRVRNLPHAITPEDVDQQPSWFGWLANTLSFEMKSNVKGSIPSHLKTVAISHLGRADFTSPDGRVQNCNVIYPMKGVIWFPKHILYPAGQMSGVPYSFLNVLIRRGPNSKSCQFRCTVEPGHNAYVCDDLDMVCAFTARCPDVKDNFVKHLPKSVVKDGTSIATIIVRNKDGTTSEDTNTVSYGKVGHKYMSFMGGSYHTNLAVNGTCMAPLITEGRSPTFCGVHMGGNGNGFGVMMTITKEKAEDVISKLLLLPGVRGLSQANDLPDQQYGIDLLQTNEVHKNAVLIKDMDNTAEIEPIGSTRLRSEAKSRVEQSCISPHVEKYFGVSNTWGAPRLKPNWQAFNATLVHIAKPSAPFLPSLLERARRDWVDPIVSFASSLNAKQPIVPLTDKQCIMGVPGVRFLEPMPMDTSMGFPVFGPKTRFFHEIREGEVLIDRIPNDEVKAECKRLLECWKKGERAYPVTVATLKDEPTPVDKEKVRVFQAGAIAMGIFIRKYYLPIARILSLNPLLSESAVGINAFGPQWEEFMDHTEKYMGEDQRVLAWDYSKYDVRMGGDVVYAVLMSYRYS